MAGPVTKSTILTTLLLLLQLFSPVHSRSSSRGHQQTSCLIPSGVPGNCVKIDLCTEVVQYLETHPLDALQYLQQRHCGFSDEVPMMCCSVTTRPEQLLPHECGPDISQRIVGGSEVGLDEFPWMALLEYQRPTGKTTDCVGALINKRYVITAAHCVHIENLGNNSHLIAVRLGEYDTSTEPDCVPDGDGEQFCADPAVTVGIEETIVHEGYLPHSRSKSNDIALIRMSRNVTFTDFIRPICLPSTPSIISRVFRTAGWGRTETRISSSVKLQVRIPFVDNVRCRNKYRTSGIHLVDSQICAGGQRGRDTCNGDSGGPLMSVEPNNAGSQQWTIVGIVSIGPSICGLPNWPGVYTKVSSFRPWILSKIRA